MPLLWRVLGALVLGVLLAKWAWVLFAPRAASIAAAPEYGATTEAGKLFGVAVVAAPVSGVVETTVLQNARLVGVFAAKTGQSGFAVLKLDDKRQVGVAVGQNVLPDVRLLEVHPYYVLLERNGVQQRLNLEENRKGAPNKPGVITYSASPAKYSAPPASNPVPAAKSAPAGVHPGSRRWED